MPRMTERPRLLPIRRVRHAVAAAALCAGAPLSAQPTLSTQELREVLPPDAKMDQFAVAPDGSRAYFVNATGELWLYDRARKSRARIASGGVSDLNLSPALNAIAFTRVGVGHGNASVWTVSLNPQTGMMVGSARQLSAASSDVPSISPDGKLVAFARDDESGVGQSIVIVPMAGGRSLVVAPSLPASVGNIRWTPDGRQLYFGLNPPVACVPEWSCLELSGANRRPTASIRRVAVAGGAVQMVAVAKGVFPGLSPDGSTLVYSDTGSARRWVVADTSGVRRDVISLPQTQSVYGWLRGTTLLIPATGNVRSLRTQSLADGGEPRTLIDRAELLLSPEWSPNGKYLSVVSRANDRAELRILNSDGTPFKTLPLMDNFAAETAWSPDLQWVAFTGLTPNGPPHVAVVEVSTGRVQRLLDLDQQTPATIRWLANSRAVVASQVKGNGSERRATFQLVDLAAKVTPLRDIALGSSPASAVAIDAASALVQRTKPADVRVLSLVGGAADRADERTLLNGRDGLVGPPILSSDGSWFALRGSAAGGASGNAASGGRAPGSTIELARVDGSATVSIPLPFTAAGGGSMRVANGGSALLVVEQAALESEPGVYLVATSAKTVQRLFSYSFRFGPPELALSPDGRSLASLVWQQLPPTVYTLDVAAGRIGSGK
jgi:Tol biopolymer transport system component